MTKADDTKRRAKPREGLWQVGKDEMNLLEHSFCGANTRPDGSVSELVFTRTQNDPVTNLPVERRMSISFSSSHGRPTIEDDEVYVGFQTLTHQRLKDGHCSPRLDFTRYELVKTIGWPDNGRSYAKINNAINRLGGVWIVCDNAFYDRAASSWVDTKFHIIDESHLFTRDKYDLARANTGEKRPRSWIRWGGPLYKSFSDGYLATFDLELYRAINGGVAKKLYRYSNKRLWQKSRYVIDLRELAEDKLGFKRGHYLSELKRLLAPSFDELSRFGYSVKLEKGHKAAKVHVASRKRTSKSESQHLPEPTGLEKELIDRGVDRVGKKSAARLVTKHPAEHIREQIENFDDRAAHGEKLSPGWLVAAIESEKGYSFRKGYKSKAQRRKEADAKRQRFEKEAAERDREKESLAEQKQRDRDATERFRQFRDSFSEAEQIRLEDEMLAKENGFIRQQFLRARRSGDIGMFHQMLWEKHIMSDYETEQDRVLSDDGVSAETAKAMV